MLIFFFLTLLSQVEQIEQFDLTANASTLEFELRELSPYTLYSMTAVIWIKKGNLLLEYNSQSP